VPEQPLPLRVLVVDDDLDTTESFRILFTLWGHHVETANDGPAALAAAAAFRPDVVLLDIMMPGMDGYEVARRLRRMPELRETLLIALTGLGRPADVADARAAGFDRHLVKPADLAELERLLGTPGRT